MKCKTPRFPTYSPTARPYQEAGLPHFHHCIEFREEFGNFAARIDELHCGNDLLPSGGSKQDLKHRI
jgi:hypothetical protein